MYICNDCKKKVEVLRFLPEAHGEYFSELCECYGEFIEAEKCEICDDWFHPDDIISGVCKKCFDYEANEENALEFGHENKVEVKINGFIAEVMDEDYINRVLEDYIKSKYYQEAIDYCRSNDFDFAEFIKKRAR